jgi:predicted class III extradiol MEMO1 family dioxygenase
VITGSEAAKPAIPESGGQLNFNLNPNLENLSAKGKAKANSKSAVAVITGPDVLGVGYFVSCVTTMQSHKQKGTGSMKKVRVLGLDVHAETVAVAIAESDGEVRSLGIIPNGEESIRKLVKKLGSAER